MLLLAGARRYLLLRVHTEFVVVGNGMLIVFLVEGLSNTAVVLTENKRTPTPFEAESGWAAYMTELWMKLC